MDIIKQFISDNFSTSKTIQRIKIFEAVRDFEYQINNGKEPEEVIKNKSWYCTSKHRLLKRIYEELWYKTELCFAPFTFDMIYLPDNMRNWWLANKKQYHTFLKLWIDWNDVNIDATYNKELRNFYVVNENRDWISNQKMICEFSQIYVPQNQQEEDEIKKLLNNKVWFTDQDKKRILEYNQWVRNQFT